MEPQHYNNKKQNVKYGQLCYVIESQCQDTPWFHVMTSGEGKIVAWVRRVTWPPLVDNSDGEIESSDADQIFSTRQKGWAACGRDTDGPLPLGSECQCNVQSGIYVVCVRNHGYINNSKTEAICHMPLPFVIERDEFELFKNDWRTVLDGSYKAFIDWKSYCADFACIKFPDQIF